MQDAVAEYNRLGAAALRYYPADAAPLGIRLTRWRKAFTRWRKGLLRPGLKGKHGG
jgi:hypothetical protein